MLTFVDFHCFSASRIIKKDILDTPSDGYESYEENLINENNLAQENIEDLEVQEHERFIVKCLETVNEVRDMEDGLEKDLLMDGKSFQEIYKT